MTQIYLNRFIEAHTASYNNALNELELGLKTTHWMWFVFPRAAGLGRSDLAKYYAIEKLSEAKAFATHKYLGTNYWNCLQALLTHRDTPIDDILGEVDSRNLQSSLTLFNRVETNNEMAFLISEVLEQFFFGNECKRTLKLTLDWTIKYDRGCRLNTKSCPGNSLDVLTHFWHTWDKLDELMMLLPNDDRLQTTAP